MMYTLEEFEENHFAHSALLGGGVAFLLSRRGATSSRNSLIAGGLVGTVAYLYMKKFGHGLPSSKSHDVDYSKLPYPHQYTSGYSAVM